MIGGRSGAFNPTRSEQEMPYKAYRPVLGYGQFEDLFRLRLTKKMPARGRVGIGCGLI
jgi:hypothetical protein